MEIIFYSKMKMSIARNILLVRKFIIEFFTEQKIVTHIPKADFRANHFDLVRKNWLNLH